MSIKIKIQARLDALELALHEGKHLSPGDGQEEVEVLINGISKFYSILPDEDRDFIAAARYAVAEKCSWG